jgi:monoamine oxidase
VKSRNQEIKEFMGFSRRQFLMRVGQAGGYSAAFTMMQSLGLMPLAESAVQPPMRSNGKGTTVVILGGGIAGLVSAYELRKLGYEPVLLEARGRVGGRNWTIRNGTEVEFTDGTKQNCEFDLGHYFNAGPARLPSIHKNMLGYCSELKVPLEVEINSSRSALMQSDKLNGGKAVEQRQVVYDSRGHVSELLAKCIDKKGLDAELTDGDRERMLVFLRKYGDLTPDYKFKSTERAGYKVYPGAGDNAGVPRVPFPMNELLDADLWEGMLVEDTVDWQATMFQPVGGMDQIPKAFEKSLGAIIRHNADVQDIDQSETGVRIGYKDTKSGKTETVTGDYCICAMPLTVLAKTKNNFSPEVKAAIAESKYDSAYKVAWEGPRFWETDYNIYGGLSYLQQTVGIVWYPSWGLFSPRGVVVSGYGVENGTPFGALSTPAKLDASRKAVELLHPGCGEKLEKPVYISWGQIPYNLGSWISGFGRGDAADYELLLKPDGRVYFAGDHTSHIVGWQEGAAVSAVRAINLIGAKVDKRSSDAA